MRRAKGPLGNVCLFCLFNLRIFNYFKFFLLNVNKKNKLRSKTIKQASFKSAVVHQVIAQIHVYKALC